MTTIFGKYSILIFLLLILALPVSIWLFPSSGSIMGVTFFLLSFIVANTTVLTKNRKAYLKGEITREMFVRNTFLDILCILLAMVFAGLLVRYIVQIAKTQIDNGQIKFMAGITVGLVVGLGVGMLVHRLRGRVARTFSK